MARPYVRLAGAMEFPIDTIDVQFVRRALTTTVHPMGEEPQTIEAFFIEGDTVTVPRQFGITYCKERGIEYVDATSAGQDAVFPRIPEPREYQVEFIDDVLRAAEHHYDFMVRAHTGFGKCQARGTPILMFDGTIKKVEDILVGDLLMGPDSRPRRVLSLARGREEMFEVRPTKGDTHTFNRSHVLSLKRTGTSGNDRRGEIVNVSIEEYLTWSAYKKHLYKLWRTGVEFEQGYQLPYDPYFVGLYLGDGTKTVHLNLHIGNERREVMDYLRRYLPSLGLSYLETSVRGCVAFSISKQNPEFTDFVQLDLTQDGERRIPQEYLTASRENRLQLLAGLVDTDAHMIRNCYEFSCKDRAFAEQVAFLARSLGLAAYISEKHGKAQGWEHTRLYYRVNISGETDAIPVLTESRASNRRAQKKNALVTGFDVVSVGEGDYYGFTLDGDHLYLLGDFTVTHNTISSLIVAARLGRTTLVIVDQDNLKDQWVEALGTHFGIPPEEVGIIQGDQCKYEGCSVTVAMVQTLISRDLPQEVYDYFGTVIADELHVFGAPVYSLSLYCFPAMYRFGVSATPTRKDNGNKILAWHLGVVRVAADKEHKESNVYFIRQYRTYSWYANISPKLGRWINEITQDGQRNMTLAEAILWLYGTGRDILVISDRISQLKDMMSLCYYLGVPEEDMGLFTGYDPVYRFEKEKIVARKPKGYVRGTEYTPIGLQSISKRVPTATLNQIKESKRIIFATYGKFQKGVDVPRLNAGVDISPRGSAEQTQGRILREVIGKVKSLWITTIDWNNPRAIFGWINRAKDYVKGNNSAIYEWLEEGGTERWELDEIIAEAKERKNQMASQRIVQQSNGLYTLAAPSTVRADKAQGVRDTIKTIQDRIRSRKESGAPEPREKSSARRWTTPRPSRATPSRKPPPR